MGLVWSLVGILSGTLIALQAPINADLGRALGFPVAAAAASFVSGAIALVAIAFVMSQAQGATIAWRVPPPWLLVTGGLLGATYVTSVITLTPRLGTAATMAFVVAGQLASGLLIDHLGLFNLAVREITLGRAAGAVLLFAGALLIRVY